MDLIKQKINSGEYRLTIRGYETTLRIIVKDPINDTTIHYTGSVEDLFTIPVEWENPFKELIKNIKELLMLELYKKDDGMIIIKIKQSKDVKIPVEILKKVITQKQAEEWTDEKRGITYKIEEIPEEIPSDSLITHGVLITYKETNKDPWRYYIEYIGEGISGEQAIANLFNTPPKEITLQWESCTY